LPQGPHGETEGTRSGDLHLVLPAAAIGEAKLIIQLVAPDDGIIADTVTILKD
jgi:hypothetical protein